MTPRSRTASRRRLLLVAVPTIAAVVALLVAAAPVRADRLDAELAEVRAARERAQARADEAAGRIADALARLGELDTAVAELEQAIDDGESRAGALRAVAQQRAVEAYTGGGVTPLALFDSGDVLDPARRVELLELTRADENATLDELSALTEDLAERREQLARDRAQQSEVLAALRAEQDVIERELAAVGAAEARLRAAVAEEEAAERARQEEARAAAAARRAAAPAATTTTAASGPTTSDAGPADGATTTAPATAPATTAPATTTAPPPPPPPPPSPSGIVCPIAGPVSFVDSWGAPRSGGRTHQGVDLMSPTGTPNVAVVSGEIRQSVGSLAGISVYLYGDDGHAYWYFHLSAWEGGPRRVAQGEVIGYTGDTGNATGVPHTHFEYHPGGGAAVNPYPLVAEAC
jgi:murein DD-endopeptidase MepM/ murein hydrolase activator NlpD